MWGTQVFLGRPTLNLLNQRHDTGEILESLSDRLHNLVVPLENRKDLFLHLKEKESQHPLFVSYSTKPSPRATGSGSSVFAEIKNPNAKH